MLKSHRYQNPFWWLIVLFCFFFFRWHVIFVFKYIFHLSHYNYGSTHYIFHFSCSIYRFSCSFFHSLCSIYLSSCSFFHSSCSNLLCFCSIYRSSCSISRVSCSTLQLRAALAGSKKPNLSRLSGIRVLNSYSSPATFNSKSHFEGQIVGFGAGFLLFHLTKVKYRLRMIDYGLRNLINKNNFRHLLHPRDSIIYKSI